MQGTIVEVMESWPLQLIVEVDTVRHHVGLLSETTVTRAGQAVDPGELSPEMQVRVEGDASGHLAMTAQAIEIVSSKADPGRDLM